MARFSLCELLPDVPMIEIVDVGAFAAAAPVYSRLMAAGRARVTGFEPHEPARLALAHRHGPPHRFLPHFVGDGEPAKFHETNVPYTSSLYPPNPPVLAMFNDMSEETTLVRVHDVPTVRLDDAVALDDVDYLKIDIQGGELDAFRGGETLLAAAVVVHTEVCFVELYRGQPLFGDIDCHLRSRGFWFHTLLDVATRTMKPMRIVAPGAAPLSADQGVNQKLWADAVYVKALSGLDALSTAKLHKFAVLLHDLYGSFDIAHGCLGAADARDGTEHAAGYRGALTAARA